MSYLHGRIDENYKVVNQNILHPYDKRCRSYILFLSDVTRVREVLGPQTNNRVIVVPRSTQWKLQEFLSSKSSSDIINLLVVGESVSADATKVCSFIRAFSRLSSLACAQFFATRPSSFSAFHAMPIDASSSKFHFTGASIRSVHSPAVHGRLGLKHAGRSDIMD